MTSSSGFNERKAAQLAAFLLTRAKGEMYVLKLMKLLYIVDREAFKELGHPVTYDCYVSMDNGPVLSRTYNLMNGMEWDCAGYWTAMISDREDNKLRVSDDCEVASDALSKAELAIADRVFEEFGRIPRFDLARMTHSFPEWQDPQGSSLPIPYESILQAVGYDNEEIADITSRLAQQEAADRLFNVA